MREAEEAECFGLPLPPFLAFLDRVAAKADQPGLTGMQRQFELAQTLLQFLQERFGLVLVLKANDEIVRITDDYHVARRHLLTPAMDP